MQMNIKTNLSMVQKAMASMHKKQVPFAMARALTDTAFEVRDKIVNETYPRSFTVRNKRFPRAMFRVGPAKKTNLVATVSDVLGRDYMVTQATGGTKTARGQNIAIPTREIKRLVSGRVSKAKQPRNLLNAKGFKTKLRGGQQVIAENVGRGKNKQRRILYILEPSVFIRKRFPFYEDARGTARSAFRPAFNKRFAQAKRTARR
jgi:hypothetical protein